MIPGCLLPAVTKPGPIGHNVEGWMDHMERHFGRKNWSFNLQDSLGRPCCGGLGTGVHKQAGGIAYAVTVQ